MTFAAGNRRYHDRKWVADGGEAEILAFGTAMALSGYIETSTGLIDYFTTPHAWSREHRWWEANDRTDDPIRWEAGQDEGFRHGS